MDMNNEGHLCSILYKCEMAQRGQKQINQKLLGSMPLLTGRRCRGLGMMENQRNGRIYIYLSSKMILFFVESC